MLLLACIFTDAFGMESLLIDKIIPFVSGNFRQINYIFYAIRVGYFCPVSFAFFWIKIKIAHTQMRRGKRANFFIRTVNYHPFHIDAGPVCTNRFKGNL